MKRITLLLMFLCLPSLARAQQKKALSAASATCTTTSCLTVTVDPTQGGATFTISANPSANTIQFEASGDGGSTVVAISATPSNSSTSATSTTSTGTWQVNTSGYTNLYLRMSTLVGGTTTVSIIQGLPSARGGSGGGGGGSVTSITATGPIVVTPSPLTNTGVISCPTCGAGSVTGSGSSGQIALWSSASALTSDASFQYNKTATNLFMVATNPETEVNAAAVVSNTGTVDNSATGQITLAISNTLTNNTNNSTLNPAVISATHQFSGTGSWANVFGVIQGQVQNTGVGSAADASAFYARPAINSGGGSITNAYGFYAAAQTVGGTNYGFFSASTNIDHFGSVTVAGASGVSVSSDGVHNGEVSLICNTTNAALPANTVSLLGCTAASNTAWGITLPTAEPASAGILHLGAAASHYSAATVSAVSLSADVTGTLPNSSVAAAPLPTPGSTCTFTAPRTYCICTTTCTITVPVPAAGYEFCALNSDNVATVITMSAIGSSARYENTARTAYGTAGTGTFVSGGAVGDKACLLGLDSTHYLTVAFTGTWTAN